jgi:hypothetical protein
MYGYAIYYLEIQNGLEDPSYQAIVKNGQKERSVNRLNR